MRRSLAEAIDLSCLCPMCMYIGSESDVIKHMMEDHTDKEVIEHTGWDIEEFEPDMIKCPTCRGRGKIPHGDERYQYEGNYMPCPNTDCKGTGEIPKPTEEEDD